MRKIKSTNIAGRFRGFLPVVIDVETAGLNPDTDALLEIAAVMLTMDESGRLVRDRTIAYHVEPFLGANIDPKALEVTGIDPYYPLRFAIYEQQALHNIFVQVRKMLEITHCQRAVLVGHNPAFDLAFIHAAMQRCRMRHAPFHGFTTFDTATLSALILGETVLARAVRRANISFNVEEAHSAIYDAEKTAELFCYLVNAWQVGG